LIHFYKRVKMSEPEKKVIIEEIFSIITTGYNSKAVPM